METKSILKQPHAIGKEAKKLQICKLDVVFHVEKLDGKPHRESSLSEVEFAKMAREMNEYKMYQMEVHQQSLSNTK